MEIICHQQERRVYVHHGLQSILFNSAPTKDRFGFYWEFETDVDEIQDVEILLDSEQYFFFCTKLLQHCTAKTIYWYFNGFLLEYCIFYEYWYQNQQVSSPINTSSSGDFLLLHQPFIYWSKTRPKCYYALFWMLHQLYKAIWDFSA